MTRPAGQDGALVLIATPIGNLGDLSPRAIETLASADVIACEDTRRTRKLLSYAGVHARRLIAVHDHNEAAQIRHLLAAMKAGERVALVTDAGTPGISDPGERLVAAAAAADIAVEVVPGPSAAIAALVVSGLPTGRWCFEGFLPRRGTGRTERLAALATEERTSVLFEAPHRLRQTLADLAEACGLDRRVVIVRELTKMFEEIWRGSLADALDYVEGQNPRGEVALVLAGAFPPPRASSADIEQALRSRLEAGEDRKTAISAVATDLGVPKREVYAIAIKALADELPT
jgi:16S rRNA (cytidine1402-2'-O)-methyltransferase